LIPDGYNIEVTNENKKEYVKKFCEAKMKGEAETQITGFVKGF